MPRTGLWIGLMAVLVALPSWAQDDMYFVPKKKAKVQRTEKKTTPMQPSTWEHVGETPTRDVDEYNRRYRSGYTTRLVNDTLYLNGAETIISYEDTLAADAEELYLDGVYDYPLDDYTYSRRLLRFRAPTVGMSISSPLYWDLRYGPNSIYWDVYDDGFYAYAYPSVWNPYYYDPFYYPSWHYNHWYMGWNYGWHAHWPGWHRPIYGPRPPLHHGPGSNWTATRPHTSRRQGVTFPARGGNRPAGTTGNGSYTRPAGSGRGQSSYSRPTNTTQPQRNSTTRTNRSSRTQRNTATRPSRPDRGTTYTPSQPVRQHNSGSFNTGGGNRGGSMGGGSRSGGGRGRR